MKTFKYEHLYIYKTFTVPKPFSFVQVQVLLLLITGPQETLLCKRGSHCQKKEHADITNRAIAG